MLKRSGENAQAESARRVDELAEDGDHAAPGCVVIHCDHHRSEFAVALLTVHQKKDCAGGTAATTGTARGDIVLIKINNVWAQVRQVPLFLCDEMLRGLGRCLSAISPALSDEFGETDAVFRGDDLGCFLANHDRGRVGVAADYRRHDAGIRHP